MDLGSFLASGRAAAQGHNPYGVYDLTIRFQSGDVQGFAINRNPPVSLLVFQLFSSFEPSKLFRVWYFLSLAIYGIIVVLLCRAFPARASPLRVLWAFSLAGVWSTVNLGQIYIPLVLASIAIWLSLQKGRHKVAGLLLGCLVAIKPNFLVWPAMLALAGFWLAAATAIIAAGLLSLVPILIYGPSVYAEWIGTFASHPWIAFPTNASLFGLMARLGSPSAGIALSAILLGSLAAWSWRHRPSILVLSDLAILGSVLASPEAWAGYTLFLLPLFYRRSWPPLIAGAAVLLLVPESVILSLSRLSSWYFAAFAFLDNAALLLLLAALAKEAIHGDGNAACVDARQSRPRDRDIVPVVQSG